MVSSRLTRQTSILYYGGWGMGEVVDMAPRAIYPSLEGQTVFVTGGGSGIGAAIVAAFAEQRAKPAFIDIAVDASRMLVAAVAAQTGITPRYIPGDIREIGVLQQAIVETGERLGDIAVLVNNAANDDRHRTVEVTPDYWDERMAINLRPMFFAAQSAVPQMKRRGGGVIVNFGSTNAKAPSGDTPVYATAKAAVHGLTRTLAREFGPFNIRVNTIVPGWVMTERQVKMWLTPASDAQRARSQCLPARIMPEDIASAVLFLASDAASKCTAQEFVVDAGGV
jgi:D-xylose 1-dehydrogenase